MTYGLAAAYANDFAATLAGTTFTPPVALWAKLHIGDPGAAGTANPSSVVTRQQVTWGTAAAGQIAITNIPSWGTWAGTSPEILTGLSLWDAATLGVFWLSVALPVPVTVVTGTPLTLAALTVVFAQVAA